MNKTTDKSTEPKEATGSTYTGKQSIKARYRLEIGLTREMKVSYGKT